MRKQKRPDAPKVWIDNQEKWKRQWLALRSTRPSAPFQWYTVDKQKANEIALPILMSMTQDHCAFCDAYPCGGVSNNTIEHHKPKGDDRFTSEAYTWENLYYCCDYCQSAKSDKWEDGLLRPDADDYLHQTYFEFDFTTGQIQPNPVATTEDQYRAKVTIRLYGLDHDVRRKNRRLTLRARQRAVVLPIDEFTAYRDYVENDPMYKFAAQGDHLENE